MTTNIWEEGKEEEIKFWKGWLGGKGKAYEKPRPLSSRLAFMIDGKKEAVIANLGAGPVSLIGDYHDSVKVKVVSSDILADKFAKILEELHLKPISKVEQEDMAKLSYEDNSFDIVYCTNALDHSQDPYSALKEMVRVCKPGGYIYLYHVAHEGQRHKYRNLHKWNIDMTEDGDCIFWTNDNKPQTNTFLLSEIYPGFKTTIEIVTKAAFITSFIQKK